MYEPKFNSVLVQIDDKDAEWGGENQESMLGKSFSKGTVILIGSLLSTHNNPVDSTSNGLVEDLQRLVGKEVLWNEGVEAGTTFDGGDGKEYGFIYYWDIRGVKQ